MIIETEKVIKDGVEMTQEIHEVNGQKFRTCYSEDYAIFEVEYDDLWLADWDYSDPAYSREKDRKEHINMRLGSRTDEESAPDCLTSEEEFAEEFGDEFDEDADRIFGIDQYPGGEGFDQDVYINTIDELDYLLKKGYLKDDVAEVLSCTTSWV